VRKKQQRWVIPYISLGSFPNFTTKSIDSKDSSSAVYKLLLPSYARVLLASDAVPWASTSFESSSLFMRLIFVSGPIENQIFIERRDVSGGRSRERGLLQI
jgi:hypothetical protein